MIKPKTLVVFHCFYPHLFQEVNGYILNLRGIVDYEVVVSVPLGEIELVETIQRDYPEYHVLELENRGQDVGAFIEILNRYNLLSYAYILKVHTKRNRSPRPSWRQDLLSSIAGSPERIRIVLEKLEDPQITMVGCGIHLNNNAYGNIKNIKRLTDKLLIETWNQSKHAFIAGTIFWAKAHLFERLKEVGLSIVDFEPGYKTDLLLQHAIERVFGLLALQNGGVIQTFNPLNQT